MSVQLSYPSWGVRTLALVVMTIGFIGTNLEAGSAVPFPGSYHTETVTHEDRLPAVQQHSSIYDSLAGAITGEQAWWIILLFAFLAGVLTSFTPCLYPMIPVTIGILQAQAAHSFSRQLIHAASYVLGIATVYAALGYLSATSSVIFGQWMSNLWIVILMMCFFVYLAGSLFGLYELYLPRLISAQASLNRSHSPFSTYLFGVISGAMGSPCLTPVLALLLGYAAKTANPVIGFMTLFAFALGMGMLLMLIGLFSGLLIYLPKAGQWMEEVKYLFAFVMLGMAVSLLDPFISYSSLYVLYAAIAAASAIYFCYTTRQLWHDENYHVSSLKTNPAHEGERFRKKHLSYHLLVKFIFAVASITVMVFSIALAHRVTPKQVIDKAAQHLFG